MNKKAAVIFLILTFLYTMIPLAFAGDHSTYLIYDGDDDRCSFTITESSSVDITGQNLSLTWEAWIYPETFGENGYGRIMNYFNINLGSNFWIATGGMLGAQFGCQGTESVSYAVSNAGHITLNEWNHVVAVMDNMNFTLYINTVQPLSYSQFNWGMNGTHLSSAGAYFNIGTRYESGLYEADRTFDGYIDEFRFYDRAITYKEISYSYSNIEPQNQTGLLCWYRFNEGSGGVTYDETANNNDLTLLPDYPSNAPAWTPVQSAQDRVSDNLTITASVIALLWALIVIVDIIYLFNNGKPSVERLWIHGIAMIILLVVLLALAGIALTAGT